MDLREGHGFKDMPITETPKLLLEKQCPFLSCLSTSRSFSHCFHAHGVSPCEMPEAHAELRIPGLYFCHVLSCPEIWQDDFLRSGSRFPELKEGQSTLFSANIILRCHGEDYVRAKQHYYFSQFNCTFDIFLTFNLERVFFIIIIFQEAI